MNIPIYRAKKIDSDEYVIGYYSPAYDIHHYIITHLGVDTKVDVVYQMSTDIHKIDPTTLAIHFPNMIDSQGNKIFASLDRYYLKGADILENDSFLGDYSIQVAIYSEGCFYAQDKDGEMYNLCENWEKLKAIGIQE